MNYWCCFYLLSQTGWVIQDKKTLVFYLKTKGFLPYLKKEKKALRSSGEHAAENNLRAVKGNTFHFLWIISTLTHREWSIFSNQQILIWSSSPSPYSWTEIILSRYHTALPDMNLSLKEPFFTICGFVFAQCILHICRVPALWHVCRYRAEFAKGKPIQSTISFQLHTSLQQETNLHLQEKAGCKICASLLNSEEAFWKQRRILCANPYAHKWDGQV